MCRQRFLKRPTPAILATNKEIIDRPTRGPHVGSVPLDLVACAERDVAEEHNFGQRPGVVKARACGFPGLAGYHPLGMMAGRTWQRRLGSLIPRELLLGQQPEAAPLGMLGQEAALLSHEDAAAR